MRFLVILFFCSISLVAFSQTKHTVDSLQKVEQSCLDSGIHMPYCAYTYLGQMDSLLNVIYKKYTATLNPSEKAGLKTEQLNWLKKRDSFFIKQDNEYNKNRKSGEWGSEMRVIGLEEKAGFVEERVLFFIKKYEARVKNRIVK